MPGIFITGTGTDIGKTYIAAHLIRYLRARRQAVRAFKPVVTGYLAESAETSDCAALLDALGLRASPESIAALSPWRYRAALAPASAAPLEGRQLEFEAVAAFTADVLRTSAAALTIVEGIGGVMVPFDGEHTQLDVMSRAAAPVGLVAGTYLGALSHTLTALEALSARGLRIACVVVNESPASSVTLAQTVDALTSFVARIDSRIVPLGRDPTAGAIEAACAAIEAELPA